MVLYGGLFQQKLAAVALSLVTGGAMLREFLLVIRNPVAIVIVLHRRPNGFLGQDRTVELMGRQSVQRFYHSLV